MGVNLHTFSTKRDRVNVCVSHLSSGGVVSAETAEVELEHTEGQGGHIRRVNQQARGDEAYFGLMKAC